MPRPPWPCRLRLLRPQHLKRRCCQPPQRRRYPLPQQTFRPRRRHWPRRHPPRRNLRRPLPLPLPLPLSWHRRPWQRSQRQNLRARAGSIASSPVCAKPAAALPRCSPVRALTTRCMRSLKTALLMADTGVKATQHLLDRSEAPCERQPSATHPVQVRQGPADRGPDRHCCARWKRRLVIGVHQPTVIMVAGVNGAGKTTSIGKLTTPPGPARRRIESAAGRGRHLSCSGARTARAYGLTAIPWRSSARKAATPPP
jgi:hypothetical protein